MSEKVEKEMTYRRSYLPAPNDIGLRKVMLDMDAFDNWCTANSAQGRWYAKGVTKIAKHMQVLDQSVALWGSESAIWG